MKKIFTVLLMVLMISIFTNCYATDGDKYNDGSWRIDSTGALKPISGGSLQVIYELATTRDTLTLAESGKTVIYDPTTIGTAATFTLPTATTSGMEFTFVAGDASAISVDPYSTEQIAYSTCSAGDKITASGASSDSVTVVSYATGKWAVKNMNGTWTDGD